MLGVLLATALAAPCDPGVLERSLAAAEAAWSSGDREAAVDPLAEVRRHRGCGDPVGIARAFRIEALVVGPDDLPTMERAVAASLAAHPLLPMLPAMAEQPEALAVWARVQERGVSWSVGPPQLVNGLRTPLVPRGARVGGHRPRRLTRVGLGLGVVAGGLYGAAWASRRTFDRKEGLPAAERLPSYRATNAFSVASLSAAVASVTVLGVRIAL